MKNKSKSRPLTSGGENRVEHKFEISPDMKNKSSLMREHAVVVRRVQSFRQRVALVCVGSSVKSGNGNLTLIKQQTKEKQ